MGNVLGRVRLSRSTDESTSVARQRELIQQWSDAHGHDVIGWAVDEDVSGSVPPFETPSFGQWLTDPARMTQFDIIAAWKLDRLGRNARQLNKLFGWCEDHGKTLVSTAESIDLGTWAGRMLANVIAGLAEGELEAIRERQLDSRRKLRETGRWSGGKVPFGYRSSPLDGGGWTLVIDPLSSSVVRKIVDAVLEGKPITRLARELNDEHYLTPGDYHRAVKAGLPSAIAAPDDERFSGLFVTDGGSAGAGRKVRSKWSPTTLRQMLQSKAILGHAHHDGETVRDDDGMPVMIAEPLVSSDEWELLQATLSRNLTSRTIRRAETSPMLGVLVCYKCGTRLHHTQSVVRGKLYRYYRCDNRDTAPIPAEESEARVEEEFLEQVGDLEVRERVWVPGDSREAELREAITALDDLTKLVGTMSSANAKQRLLRQIGALDERIAELESAPSESARWEYKPTGQTYRRVWEASNPEERRLLLIRSGITLYVHMTVEGKRSASNPGLMRSNMWVPNEITDYLSESAVVERPRPNVRMTEPPRRPSEPQAQS